MKIIAYVKTSRGKRDAGFSLLGIAALAAMGFCVTSFAPVEAQGTTASIFGHGPAGATVTARSTTGAQRHITIADNGRYKLLSVPMGNYTVTLDKDEKTVDTRKNINVTVGRGAQVDFACENDKCEAGGG